MLLLIEVIGISLGFDTGALPRGTIGADIVGLSPQLLQLATAVAAAVVIFNADGLRQSVRCLVDLLNGNHPRWLVWVVLHSCALALLIVVASRIFSPRLQLSPVTWALMTTVWFILAAWALVTWSLALLPAAAWLRLTYENRSTIAIGLLTGSVATAIAFGTAELWQPLGVSTLYLVSGLLQFVYSDVVCDSAKHVIGTTEFSVRIAPACSGYEGIGLIEVFLAVYLWLHRAWLRFPHALILLPIGAVVIWMANAARIFGLVVIGTSVSPGIAQSGFHSQAGWIGFNVVALGLVMLTGRQGPWRLRTANVTSDNKTNPATPYLMPFLTILAVTLLTTAFSNGIDALYPLRVIAVAAVLWAYRREYLNMEWHVTWVAVAAAALTFLAWITLAVPFLNQQSSPFSGLDTLPDRYAGLWMFFRLCGYILIVPIAEELAFRGYLLRRLIQFEFQKVQPGTFTVFSLLVSSVLFGVMHGRCWIAGTVAGMLFACALYFRGRLADAIVAHTLTNALLAGYAFYHGDWWLIS